MKLALITHHWVPNFGANLQALSSYNFLKKLHEVDVINYIPENLVKRYSRVVSNEQADIHLKFSQEFLSLTPILRNANEIKEYCYEQKYDLIISGSDAIFRMTKEQDSHEGPFPNPFWLTWAKEYSDYNPKTAFLAGSATGSAYYSFPSKLKRAIAKELNKADFISVRDSWTKWMFQLITWGKINPEICPDPASVFNDSFSVPEKFQDEIKKNKSKYILFSARPERFTEKWISEFVKICNDNGFAVYGLPIPEHEMHYQFEKNITLPLHPLTWFSWIKNSSGFIGERFHPAAFCIFNGIPFFSIDIYSKRGFKNHFNFISIKPTSKTYDICKRSNALTNCYDDNEIKYISPLKAFKILMTCPIEKTLQYADDSRIDFNNTINKILML